MEGVGGAGSVGVLVHADTAGGRAIVPACAEIVIEHACIHNLTVVVGGTQPGTRRVKRHNAGGQSRAARQLLRAPHMTAAPAWDRITKASAKAERCVCALYNVGARATAAAAPLEELYSQPPCAAARRNSACSSTSPRGCCSGTRTTRPKENAVCCLTHPYGPKDKILTVQKTT